MEDETLFEIFKTPGINKNAVKIFFILICSLPIIVSLLIFLDYDKVSIVHPKGVVNNGEIAFCVDDAKEGTFGFIIDAWAFKNSEDMKTVQNYILLKDKSKDNYVLINSSMMKRNDLNVAFAGDGKDYSNGGIYARVNKSHLEKGHEYEIFIWYLSDGNDILVPTGKIINYKEESKK